MRIYLGLLFVVFFVSCKGNREGQRDQQETGKVEEIVSANYELYKPVGAIKAVLVLFGGYPESPKDIKTQFNILPLAGENNIAVVLMNFNQTLFMEEDEKMDLALRVEKILKEHRLPEEKIYIGGFSSGGNVSLLLGSFLVSQPKLGFVPEGVFIVDSPIDLSQLYFASEKNIARNFSKLSVDESNWIIKTLGGKFGNPHDDLSAYEQYAVYTYQTDNSKNIENLKNVKLRFYTEPDTLWWKENRMADYEQTNAYYIKQLTKSLVQKDFRDVAYIPTENRGYRANGERHPHSWAIVETSDLIHWILAENQ